MTDFVAIKYHNEKLTLINQTKLPLSEEYIVTDNYERIAEAIEKLEVRGAPAIGVSAAYAFALAFKEKKIITNEFIRTVHDRLSSTRPTAVNLFFALKRMVTVVANNSNKDLFNALISEAVKIHNEDILMCDKIGTNGLEIFKKKSVVITHCNTGALATGGSGTALSVIKTAFKNNLVEHVFVDETRPLLQGSRLTAFELEKAGIPFSIIVDSAASHTIKNLNVDLAITGADRIASNGDSANKIGTYSLAISCNYHKIPFYIVAPSSTIDFEIESGEQIKIEERSGEEITAIKNTKITKGKYSTYSPAFDVTPNELIEGIITEEKVFNKPYRF